MNKARACCIAGLLAAFLVGCAEDPIAPPLPSEPTWNVLTTVETFVDVWGCSHDAVFALGEASLLFYNGSSWTVLADPPSGSRAIWGTGPENLFVIALIAESGRWHADVYHYDGRTWEILLDRRYPLFQLRDIWGSSDRDIFAVGDGGTILHYDGFAWSQMSSGTDSDLRCLWGTSSSDVFAAGSEGTVLHYDGSAWTSMSAAPRWLLLSIWASSSSDVYCIGRDPTSESEYNGTILHFDGFSWRPVISQPWMLWNVWGSSSTDIFAVGDEGTILHSDGVSWSEKRVSGLSARAVWGSSSHDVFVVGGGANPGIYPTDSWYPLPGSLLLRYDGSDWRPQASDMANAVRCYLSGVGGNSTTDIYFVGGTGRGSDAAPLIQGFDGSSFGRPGDVGMAEYGFDDVWATPDAVFAVGEGVGACFDPSLTSGTRTPAGYSVWALSRVNAFITWYSGRICHYDGSSWNLMTTGTMSTFFDIWGSSETDVFAVGEAGMILHYDGSSWAPMPTETSQTLWGVWGSSSADVYAVGDSGTILHYDGVQWKAVPSGTQNRLTGVWGSSDRDVFVVGGIILHYDGQTWTTMSNTHHGAHKVWGSGAHDVYVTEGKRILRYGFQ